MIIFKSDKNKIRSQYIANFFSFCLEIFEAFILTKERNFPVDPRGGSLSREGHVCRRSTVRAGLRLADGVRRRDDAANHHAPMEHRSGRIASGEQFDFPTPILKMFQSGRVSSRYFPRFFKMIK